MTNRIIDTVVMRTDCNNSFMCGFLTLLVYDSIAYCHTHMSQKLIPTSLVFSQYPNWVMLVIKLTGGF